jgi:hypothetical protein
MESGNTWLAHVWCAINRKELIVSFRENTRISDLIVELQKTWGVTLPRSRRSERYGAGWCALARDGEGIYVPLHLDDVIPKSTADLASVLARSKACHGEERRRWREGDDSKVNSCTAESLHEIERYELSRSMAIEIGDLSERHEFIRMWDINEIWPQHQGAPVNIELCIVISIQGG